MLEKIVRPLVQTQIRLLANSQTTKQTLIETIIRWLGYLGVNAEVNQLCSQSQRIQVTLTVGKPNSCEDYDWQKIINNIGSVCTTPSRQSSHESRFQQMTQLQQLQLARLLAYLLQAGDPDEQIDWQVIKKTVSNLQLEEPLLLMIQSALKVPQSLKLLEKIDPDVAAYAFPLAVQIAWLDQQVNSQENEALSALLELIK